MRALPAILLFGTVFCNAQQVLQHPEGVPDNTSTASTIQLTAAVRSTELTEISGSSAEASLAPNASGTPAIAVAAPVQPVQALSPRKTEMSFQTKRVWWALTAMQHGGAAFDAWSTRQSLSSGNGYERDPLMKPFANSPAIYPALQILPTGLDYLSNRMLRSQNTMVRRLWWMPQTVSTIGFVWSGARNLHVASLR